MLGFDGMLRLRADKPLARACDQPEWECTGRMHAMEDGGGGRGFRRVEEGVEGGGGQRPHLSISLAAHDFSARAVGYAGGAPLFWL